MAQPLDIFFEEAQGLGWNVTMDGSKHWSKSYAVPGSRSIFLGMRGASAVEIGIVGLHELGHANTADAASLSGRVEHQMTGSESSFYKLYADEAGAWAWAEEKLLTGGAAEHLPALKKIREETIGTYAAARPDPNKVSAPGGLDPVGSLLDQLFGGGAPEPPPPPPTNARKLPKGINEIFQRRV